MNKNLTLTLIVWNANVEKDKERVSVCSTLTLAHPPCTLVLQAISGKCYIFLVFICFCNYSAKIAVPRRYLAVATCETAVLALQDSCICILNTTNPALA